MPRRSPDPRQASLDLGVLPSATSTRAELVDQVKQRSRRKRDYFSGWPKTGTRVLVHYPNDDTEPGTVVNAGLWHPTKGPYCIVRLDREGAPPVTIDELIQISPEEKR